MADKGRIDAEEIKLIIGRIEEWVKNELTGDSSGHDWFHIVRVVNNGKLLSSYYKDDEINKNSIEIACLVHEINDYKLFKGNEEEGKQYLINCLKDFGLNDEYANEIENIVSKISFRGGFNQNDKDNLSLECQIVQDADRLDAIGAVGIARTFAYGGHRNRLIYHPDIQPVKYATAEAYKNNNAPSINHFYEKLLLLKDKMNTKPGKDIAEGRHQYMLQFLQQFNDEWNGKK